MSDIEIVKTQTLLVRESLSKWIQPYLGRADVIPEDWSNNLKWHVGHLVLVPIMLTDGLSGKEIPQLDDYRRWFGRDSSPQDWGDDTLPSMEELVQRLTSDIPAMFEQYADTWETPYKKPYRTQMGARLSNISESLHFSMFHDGIHFGLMLRLAKAL